jgi:4a-hydroxytetrahydrobiopterin dehydratase
MSDLANRECAPCGGGATALKGDQLTKLLAELNGWELVNEHHLTKSSKFANFLEAQRFVNHVGNLAEQQGHHPDICFGWGYAQVTIMTHDVDGLTENDFILAAKIDQIA